MANNLNMKELFSGEAKSCMTFDLTIQDDSFDFASSISSALDQANLEIQALHETIDSVKTLKPECDRLDYALAASSGALCGIIDIFFVGKPGESPLGNITDEWFAARTMNFAKHCGWKGEGKKSAIKFLEDKFQIPYDQTGLGDAGKEVFDLNPFNHHFKSLAHNPTLCGLFFSILDQFQNTSHFVSGGELISLEKADDTFTLTGNDIPSKMFCAVVNWFRHLISDRSGSANSKGRGMGIPSPFWAWTNDIITIKSSLGISVSQFDEAVNELALNIYKHGYDLRFQAAQAIPVFINELVVRTIYAVRRLLVYFYGVNKADHSFKLMWHICEPFSNATVKRMLTVAHGTFCAMDIGDAIVHGFIMRAGRFSPTEFFLRFNIVGAGRFAISLYGEGRRTLCYWREKKEAAFAEKEKAIIENYIEGLNILAYKYNDSILLTFVEDLRNSDMYIAAFNETVELAEQRDVPPERILRSKSDIDMYFKKR